MSVQNRFCAYAKDSAPLPEAPLSRPTRERYAKAVASLEIEAKRAKACPAAEKVLTAIVADETASLLRPASLYWIWVCRTGSKDTAVANAIRDRMWSAYPFEFHTALILEKEGDDRMAKAVARDQDFAVAFRSVSDSRFNLVVGGIEVLHRMGRDDVAAAVAFRYSRELAEKHELSTVEPEARLYFAALMARVGRTIPSVLPVGRELRPLLREHPEYMTFATLSLLFPNDHHELFDRHQGSLDPLVIAALVHQESAFNPRARSKSDAFGLMQTLLPTAAAEFKILAAKDSALQGALAAAQLYDPDLSIRLGSSYLQSLMRDFGGSVPLALAAYNSGSSVRAWAQAHKELKDPVTQTDLVLMTEPGVRHASLYAASILGKLAWYRALSARR